MWHPEGRALGLLRKDIDRHPENLKAVLAADPLFTDFLSTANAPEKDTKSATKKKQITKSKQIIVEDAREDQAVRSFVARNSENALKVAPKVSIMSHSLVTLP